MKIVDGSAQSSVTVEPTAESRAAWISRPHLSESLKEQLARATIILLPQEGYPDHQPVFPERTEEVFQFFKDNAPEDISVEVCMDDSEYVELASHDAFIDFGKFLCESPFLPVLLELISEYLKKFFAPQDRAKLQILTELAMITYEGPAADLPAILHASEPLVPAAAMQGLPASQDHPALNPPQDHSPEHGHDH